MKITIETGYSNEYDVTISLGGVYTLETVNNIIARVNEARDNDWLKAVPVVEYRDAEPREPFYGRDTIGKAIRAVAEDDKIAAIRLYRYLLPGTGLREAKEEVERIMSGATI